MIERLAGDAAMVMAGTRMRIGCVGLGSMGGPISERLAAAGHEVAGFDLRPADERCPRAVEPTRSVTELCTRSDVLLLSLPTPAASRQVCEEIARVSSARSARVVIEMSTIGAQSAEECAALLVGSGWDYIDAPVSGGEVGARTGLLTVMASGRPSDIDRVLPVLRTVGTKVFVVGSAPGLGQAMKLTVNFTSLATFTALAEATILGERLGLDLEMMVDVINASNARSVVSEEKFTRSVVPRTYDFGVRADLVMKDVELYRRASERADTPRTVASAVHDVWRAFLSEFPDADFTALHRYLGESRSAGDD